MKLLSYRMLVTRDHLISVQDAPMPEIEPLKVVMTIAPNRLFATKTLEDARKIKFKARRYEFAGMVPVYEEIND